MRYILPDTAKQTISFFKDFVRRNDVQKFVTRLRSELGMPEKGIKYTDEDENILFVEKDETLWYTPLRLIRLTKRSKAELSVKITKSCNDFLDRQDFEKSFFISSLLRLYVIFDEIVPVVFEDMQTVNDLLKFSDLKFDLNFYSKETPELLRRMFDDFENSAKKYPIILSINPVVSKRQIVDFIDKNWWYIKSAEKRGNKLGNLLVGKRRKDDLKLKRNDFIYENRHLPRKEIMRLVNDKYNESIEYGLVGKIISLEKKKRENK